MDTGLDSLLQQLDPARTLERTSARVDAAVNSFRQVPVRVLQWIEFQQLLVAFVRHLEARILRLRSGPWASFEYDWGRCARLLMREFGGPSGDKAAFELARTGNEGGVRHVLRKVAERLTEEYADNEIRILVIHRWNRLSLREQFSTMDEYLARFGRLLSAELTEGSAARLRANFSRVLAEHPRLLQRLRRVGR